MAETAKVNDILDFEKKKKKKNKSAVVETKAEAEPEPVTETTKKIKKVKPTDEEVPESSMQEGELNLDGKKKKKKKVTLSDEVDKVAEEMDMGLDFKNKKKKKPAVIEGGVFPDEKPSIQALGDADAKEGTDAVGYAYDWLLKRVFSQIIANNPELMSDQKRRLVMLPPQLARVGTKKTSFVNFAAVAWMVKREPSHLSSYMLTELGTAGSMDANGALLIRGRYQSKHIEPVLINYCRNYVLCGTCQSPDTALLKDSRLLFMQCRRCGSRITVKNVQGGFQAVTAKRAAMRAKAQ